MRRLLLGLALGVAACGTGPATASSADDLTSVTPSKPVQQSIGNCWVFATNAWIETMSARPADAKPVDLSEAYVSYLYWLDQISAPPAFGSEGVPFIVHPTGSWGLAADLLTRFGWMPESDFLSEPATTTFAERHEQALQAIQKEIDHGALQTPAQRADRKLVAASLANAWGLKDDVIADLTHAFGDAYDRDLQNGQASIAGTRIHKLSEITVGYGGTPKVAVTAQDLFGALPDGETAFDGVRVGPYAYSDIKPPGSDDKVRAYVLRAQKSLVQDLPLVMSETSDDVDLDTNGTYEKPANGQLSDSWYDHAVTVFDLSVQTPQFGLLPTGVTESRPDAITASLADDAVVKTFRARNSYWGRYADGSVIPFAGGTAVTDYSLDYLMWRPNFAGGRMLMRITLPNDPDMVISKTP